MSLHSSMDPVGPAPADPAPSRAGRVVGALWTPRFARYGLVGVLGIVVNLGALWALTDGAGLHTNVAAALAIELSVLSNFALNDAWTFADRRTRALPARLFQYHLVTGVGAAIQWVVFVAANLAVFLLLSDEAGRAAYAAGRDGVHAWVTGPVLDPPEVGALKYASQLVGIGIAVVWNYLANLYWTWGRAAAAGHEGDHPAAGPAVALNTLPAPSIE